MSQRRKKLETWAGRAMNTGVLVLTVFYVAEAFDRPSTYRIAVAVVAVLLTLNILWTAYRTVTGRERPSISYPRKSPATVPFDDVIDALETTDGRIEAVRRLREQHPGLNLKDAADLVDEVTARPDL
ncbi:hypothetical protein [Williamsia sp.]|uniref:hypothetical protein n=1 Tax=Williamsia sp. TaxID=1872085 RepID=UPI001A1AD0BC|nr:hypothetical protein [Williamsia sp.]MBJ7289131.1 hypothetical protein [Williamsia sp.]